MNASTASASWALCLVLTVFQRTLQVLRFEHYSRRVTMWQSLCHVIVLVENRSSGQLGFGHHASNTSDGR